MINLDPDSAKSDTEMTKAVVRANQNNAGIYGAVTRIGQVAIADHIFPPGRVASRRGKPLSTASIIG